MGREIGNRRKGSTLGHSLGLHLSQTTLIRIVFTSDGQLEGRLRSLDKGTVIPTSQNKQTDKF